MTVLFVPCHLDEPLPVPDLPARPGAIITAALSTANFWQRRGVDPSLVWFDPTVADAIGPRPLPAERVVLADARDLDPPEAAFLATSQIRPGAWHPGTGSAEAARPLVDAVL